MKRRDTVLARRSLLVTIGVMKTQTMDNDNKRMMLAVTVVAVVT